MDRLHTTSAPDYLAQDIADYVAYCRKHSSVPDAYAFALSYAPRHNSVAGREIERLINEEEAKYGRN
jgi:hypothetical protein